MRDGLASSQVMSRDSFGRCAFLRSSCTIYLVSNGLVYELYLMSISLARHRCTVPPVGYLNAYARNAIEAGNSLPREKSETPVIRRHRNPPGEHLPPLVLALDPCQLILDAVKVQLETRQLVREILTQPQLRWIVVPLLEHGLQLMTDLINDASELGLEPLKRIHQRYR